LKIDPHIIWEDEFASINLIMEEHSQSKMSENIFGNKTESSKQYPNFNKEITVFPNPFYDNVFIGNGDNGDDIKVLNLLSNIVYEGTIKGSNFVINLDSQPTGLYILMINHNGIRKQFKIIKI
jgi:hypothetical protein